jgi:hypothetical protein
LDWSHADLSAAEVEALYETFAQAPQRVKKHFVIERADGKALTFQDDKMILRALKTAE